MYGHFPKANVFILNTTVEFSPTASVTSLEQNGDGDANVVCQTMKLIGVLKQTQLSASLAFNRMGHMSTPTMLYNFDVWC
jgi:hypothetical protein